ncbi:MAG: hypothetical protein ACX94C_09770 [Phycisphaerales bacterium]
MAMFPEIDRILVTREQIDQRADVDLGKDFQARRTILSREHRYNRKRPRY